MTNATNTTEVRTTTNKSKSFHVRITDSETGAIAMFGSYKTKGDARRAMLEGQSGPKRPGRDAPRYAGNHAQVVSVTRIVTEETVINFF